MLQVFLSRLKDGWMLLRFIAVASSSVVTIVSAMLPLVLYSSVASERLLLTSLLLLLGGVFIHGVMTHVLNDYEDYVSGTDQNSPAILSGGSRLIQNDKITATSLRRLGEWLLGATCLGIIILMLAGSYKLAILLAVGLWSAWSYSLQPLQLSYKPFIGEWFAMFPAVLTLGLGGAWLVLDTIPAWALQNAVVNALFCSVWVMVHHIPDRDADRTASPAKVTSVVWAVKHFGEAFARLPALVYLGMVLICAFWLATNRPWASVGVFVISVVAISLILQMRVDDHKQVSTYETILLLLAIINGVWLGVFI